MIKKSILESKIEGKTQKLSLINLHIPTSKTISQVSQFTIMF